MNPFTIPIRRPVATSMFFLGVVLVGLIAFQRIPVELFPDLTGDQLTVIFTRPASEPEVVEREILLPIGKRVSEMPFIAETWGEVRGAGGTFRVRFERGADLKVSELELQQIAAEIARDQPAGTSVTVQAQDTSAASRFVMVIRVLGGEDRYALHDFVEERVAPRTRGVNGVSQVFVGGGSGRQVTVRVDPDRCAAMGVAPGQVIQAVQRSVNRLRFLGGVEDEVGRTAVILDGRPRGVISLGETRIVPELPVLLRHVAEVESGPGRERILFRVNGQPAVAVVVFQDEGANLVRLGRALRRQVDELRAELRPQGLDLVISVDGAEIVEDQVERLQRLALSGFAVALLVLYLFLRQWRAVGVVAVAVPVSLLVALALLYLGGHSLNLITLSGLAVGIGLLVDNSVVVYEAVQRRLEHGADADGAAVDGVRRTVRAIVAASVTTAVVFLPLVLADFDDAIIRSLLEIVALAILLPLAGSLLVAVGLVPLLARRLAAPAALRRLAALRERRRELGGRLPPDRVRGLFGGLVTAALRRPAALLAAATAAVLLTASIALPWVLVQSASQDAQLAGQVQIAVRLGGGRSLDAAAEVFDRLEASVADVEGVERTESLLQEVARGVDGQLTVYLADEDERPSDLTVARVREIVRAAAEELRAVEVLRPGEGADGGADQDGGLAGFLGQGPSEVVLSGPDSALLADLALEIEGALETVPEVADAWPSTASGLEELHVVPDAHALAAFGLTADQVLPVLRVVGREGIELPTGFTLDSGRELPLVVRREAAPAEGRAGLERLRLATPAGVLPVAALARVRRMPAPATITHHNGRREMSVFYRLGQNAPSTGPARLALEEQIAAAVRGIHHPQGTAVAVEGQDEAASWFRRLLVPAVLLLYLVLAMTFESLTLPVLVLVALPLTLLGSTWALVLTGTPLGAMALVGALTLLGLTVNPAILLVDRMQQQTLHGHRSAGAAALAAVRERARPVFMTTATTVAGLWPLALVTGRENEIWPPFATIVIGGLVTSTILTLLLIPVGFVLLSRLDRLFGRLGPWVVLGWMAATAALVTPLVLAGLLESLLWQLVTALLVAGLVLGAIIVLWRRPRTPEPAAEAGAPPLEVRHLRKVYGQPGPVGKAWRAPDAFAARVLAAGGRLFDPRQARDRIVALVLVAAGLGYLAVSLQSVFWRLVFLFATAAAASRLALDVRRARGHADAAGRVRPGGIEGAIAVLLPWLALAAFAWRSHLAPRLADAKPELGLFGLGCVAALLLLVQGGRRTARRVADGTLPERPGGGALRRPRTMWRRLARRVFGLDLPRKEVAALVNVSFRIERGMVGVLGPNGAGKTTLLRQLAGILDPSRGRITLGGVPLDELRLHLARWVGYLPQDAALPPSLSAREYLEYHALLYEIPAAERGERVERLLAEVGLAERAGERIGGYSGGMRQRVAVARTLLRLPPVIIVDEPTVGLDPRERIRFRNLLSRLAEGRVVLFSTHVVEDVAVACERVIVLAGGRLVFDGPPAELTGAARGRVWEARLPADEIARLPPSARVTDQVPEADGRARLRILHDEPPHPEARQVEPTLEEGYLVLVGEQAA